jgi:hypothetical protein
VQLILPALPGFVWVLKILFPAEGMVIARRISRSGSKQAVF